MAAKPTIDIDRLKRTLEEELRHVRTVEDAERVVKRLEELASGRTEAGQGRAADLNPSDAASEVAQAARRAIARGASPAEEAAAVITEAAQQASSQSPEGNVAQEAARQVMSARDESKPAASRGGALLKEAVLHRLGPLGALDARIFLALNNAPHPARLDRAAHWVALATNGGWYWALVLLGARLAGARVTGKTVLAIMPSVLGATFLVEYPAKALFRRKRPFIDVVRALVVGKKPGSWSFPSGHSAAGFAGAWMLSTVWPRQAPGFFSLAALIGFSRIYVGAHYPGDVTFGAFAGMALAELLRRASRWAFTARGHSWPST